MTSRRERFVLDTSVFVNPEVRVQFGSTPTEALLGFLRVATRLRGVEFYMPPTTYKELMRFVDPEKLPKEVELIIRHKPPKKYELKVPAILLYELIEDVRNRIDKGLRVAEKAARQMQQKRGDDRDVIKNLRQDYRRALREGIIDSREDVDLILLALELDAVLVSADVGVQTWADKLGIRRLSPERLRSALEESIDKRTAE